MNSLFSMLSSFGSGGGSNLLLQAVGAALRGESPQAFMKRLANQHPQLKRMNLDDLQGTAQGRVFWYKKTLVASRSKVKK